MSQPLSEYSKDAIGRVWTAADHRYLIEQLRRIDELAQDLWRYSRRNQSLGRMPARRLGSWDVRLLDGLVAGTDRVRHI